MYYATTRGIDVVVTPRYLPERSDPKTSQYVFAYTVVIANHSRDRVQLMTRRWMVTDSRGHVRNVEGDGVIGEQPVLEPGQSFEYTSGVPLPSPSGIMLGQYGMQSATGELFDIDIPAFSLDADGLIRVLH